MRLRRSIGLMTLTLCVALTSLAGSVRAQDSYPSKPIHFIVTTAAGGAGDLVPAPWRTGCRNPCASP